MSAQELYAYVFALVPSGLILAAVWYWRYSFYFHRRRRSRWQASALATLQVGGVTAIFAWWVFRAR